MSLPLLCLPFILSIQKSIASVLHPVTPHQYYLTLSSPPHTHTKHSRCCLGQFFALQIFTQYSIHPASVSLPFSYSVNNHFAFHFTLQCKLVKPYKIAFGWFSSPPKCTVLIAWWQKCSSDNPNWSTFHQINNSLGGLLPSPKSPSENMELNSSLVLGD